MGKYLSKDIMDNKDIRQIKIYLEVTLERMMAE